MPRYYDQIFVAPWLPDFPLYAANHKSVHENNREPIEYLEVSQQFLWNFMFKKATSIFT